jgi:hypothetical protein
MDLEPQADNAGKVYRFVRARDDARADVLAPDHTPPRRRLRTVGGDTIRIEGGTQALRRAMPVQVVKGDRSALVPVPDLLGALVLKAAAWATDSRDRERHSGDAAFLVSLISDPLAERDRFAGSDRKRLLQLTRCSTTRTPPSGAGSATLPPTATATWQLLVR